MSKLPKVDRQREHQANERTFLAWLRTSIALIGFGFAIARFGMFMRQLALSLMPDIPHQDSWISSENLGLLLVIFGIIVIAAALWNYNHTSWQIERGDYRPNRLMMFWTAISVIILGFFSLILMVRNERLPHFRKAKPEASFLPYRRNSHTFSRQIDQPPFQ